MQKKQQQSVPNGQNIMATILSSIPKDANVTKIAYEGPRIALYTNKPRFLMENNEIISNLVNVIKKTASYNSYLSSIKTTTYV